MLKDRNTIAFIKKMLELGYSQKQIGLMTKEYQSRIQRIAARKTFQYVESSEYVSNDFFEMNKKTLDHILTVPEISGYGELTDEDKNYIWLVKFCGGDYWSVRWAYADRSSRELRNIWNSSADFKPHLFDATKIGLTDKEIYFLLA